MGRVKGSGEGAGSVIKRCRKTSRARSRQKKSLSYSDPEALWTKIKNLTALFCNKKSLTLQKRSKKTLLHHRANHEDQKFKNHRKSISMP